MTKHIISDGDARSQALDPTHSCIVQAPAGSGKTGLLTQRFLALLARVNEPEEVLAITFTRKAAAEMRDRVLQALQAVDGPEPVDDYGRQNWRLAHAVRQRDAAADWQLSGNPNRLRILTFDALNHSLAKQLPLTSALGAVPTVAQDPVPAYRLAARRSIALLDHPDYGDDVARVLSHVENRIDQLEQLLCTMLARRDQWLGHAVDKPDTRRLIDHLGSTVVEHLNKLSEACPVDWLRELCRIAAQAAENLRRHNPSNDRLAQQVRDSGVPATDWQALPHWQALAQLLLTAKGEPRRRWDKRVGILSPTERGLDATEKARRQDLKTTLEALAARLDGDDALLAQWVWVPRLPARPPSAAQQALLDALLRVLLHAATELNVVFAETGQMDFAEVQLRALHAIGTPEQPTDLALSLDHRLQHLLIDEFQDTSVSQFKLLQTLTAGWTPDDGRTLFAVGDPMQSIYRFREAEVGLFLHAWREGIGGVRLSPLRLSVNFRSTAGIVGWVNRHFPHILARRDDAARGAVAFSPAIAKDERDPPDSVTLNASIGFNAAEEAEAVCQLVHKALDETHQGQIAILARARSHLADIARALHQSNIPYHAVDIDPLSARPVVQDLRALTRALLHPADRLSWLTMLHTPWVGIPFDDLVAIAEPARGTLPTRLREPGLRSQISADGWTRIGRLLHVLDQAGEARGRRPLREWIEGTWLRLGGLAAAGPTGAADAAAFLDLLDSHAEADGLVDFARLDEAIEQLFAAPDAGTEGRVQLMTMHKAKGLEFDTVILPGLGRSPRPDAGELLYWMETTASNGDSRLLMAPMRHPNQKTEPISDYVRALAKDKSRLESARLVYVAATRAIRRLHLLGHVSETSGPTNGKPASDSLLARLWPAIADRFSAPPSATAATRHETPVELAPLQRLAPDWAPSELTAPLTAPLNDASSSGDVTIEFEWAGSTARHVGSIVHRYLERIAKDGLADWTIERLHTLHDRLRLGLSQLGVDDEELDTAVAKATRALSNTLSDDKGRWILDTHDDARCEWPLTLYDSQAQHFVIDRSFVDDDGVRWIIDYKTGDHRDSDLTRFLDDEQSRYRDQLENYAALVRCLEHRPIRLALYFPLFAEWRTWDFDG